MKINKFKIGWGYTYKEVIDNHPSDNYTLDELCSCDLEIMVFQNIKTEYCRIFVLTGIRGNDAIYRFIYEEE